VDDRAEQRHPDEALGLLGVVRVPLQAFVG
jgi:hypothetical protein